MKYYFYTYDYPDVFQVYLTRQFETMSMMQYNYYGGLEAFYYTYYYDFWYSYWRHFNGRDNPDFTGTVLTADKPIAVFTGTGAGFMDYFSPDGHMSQMLPDTSWGKTFFTIGNCDNSMQIICLSIRLLVHVQFNGPRPALFIYLFIL